MGPHRFGFIRRPLRRVDKTTRLPGPAAVSRESRYGAFVPDPDGHNIEATPSHVVEETTSPD